MKKYDGELLSKTENPSGAPLMHGTKTEGERKDEEKKFKEKQLNEKGE